MAISLAQRVTGFLTGNAAGPGPVTSANPAPPAVVDPVAAHAVAEAPPITAHPLFSPTPAAAYRSEPASQRTFDELMSVIRNKTASVDDRRLAATEYMEMMNRVRDETIYPTDGKIDITDLAEQSHQISNSPKTPILREAISQMLMFFNEASHNPSEDPIIRAFFEVSIQFSGEGLREKFNPEDLALFHRIVTNFEPSYIRPTMRPISEMPDRASSISVYQNSRDKQLYYDRNESGRYWFRKLFECTVINVQHDSRSSRSQWASIDTCLKANPQYAGEQTWGLKGFGAGGTVGTLTFIAGVALAAPPLVLASGAFLALGFGTGIAGKISDHFRGNFEPVPSQSLSR